MAKHVVTANGSTVHGTEIFVAAQKKGVMVAFEAAVAGGVPITKALRSAFRYRQSHREGIAGIINGIDEFPSVRR